MTHIDPFAPGDSPQHPANFGTAAARPEPNPYADLFHQYATEPERERGIDDGERPTFEVLNERDERYTEWLEDWGVDADDTSGYVGMTTLLRREALAELDEDEQGEWQDLFNSHGTEEEKDAHWYGDVYPSLEELRGRVEGVEPLPDMPKSNALKEDWVEYALAVEKARGWERDEDQVRSMKLADLHATYKPQAS